MAVAEPVAVRVELPVRQRRRHAVPLPSKVVFTATAVLFLIIALAGVLAPSNPLIPVGAQQQAPSWAHLFGTDDIGRDVLSRVLHGMQTTALGAVVVIAFGACFGALVGLVSGMAGGIVDLILTRITEVFLALPGPILAIALVAALGHSYEHTLLGVAVVWWPLYARVVRAETRRLRASPHVEAARMAGTGWLRTAFRHLLPGAVASIIVTASLDISALVLTLASLSFLGLGAPAPAPELGSMTAQGMQYIFESWWIAAMPAAAVSVIAIVANLFGDALRDQFRDR